MHDTSITPRNNEIARCSPESVDTAVKRQGDDTAGVLSTNIHFDVHPCVLHVCGGGGLWECKKAQVGIKVQMCVV